ncbi:ABC-type sugar transport system, periplasmic component [Ruminiclostridium cellobioparum subsp. termitidis CT1112]|uniref:ABC-type sugar transport system, periplasmic component n=1 Tax=Ruminiclostridium cellobioparum subsp. termitidis CT1112 TaxID=1195236 RepID=S0FG85_RUMCE|nr:ABC-type sugar transport system, periplasmic component [Ruminiclostridium cellobioparum subsp. termitidis CT1112]
MIIFSSCESNEVVGNKGQKEKIELEVSARVNDQFTHNAIAKFNAKNKYIRLVVDDIPQNVNKEYSDKLAADLMAGTGPDLFCNNTDIFPSIYKAIQNKTFYDLNKLIKKDNEFKLEDYYEEIINCGEIDGNRYILPTNFDVHIFYGFDKVLKSNNINIDNKNLSWEILSNVSLKYTKSKGKYFFVPMDFQSIFESYGKSFVDYKSKKANFDSNEFINLIKSYKSIISAICPPEYAMKYQGLYWGMVKDNALILLQTYSTNPEFFWSEYNFGKKVLNSDIKLYPYPSSQSNGNYSAYVTKFAAISNKCEYPEEAFEFIKYVLSKEIQNDAVISSAPVNKEAYNEIINYFSSNEKRGKEIKNPADDKTYKSEAISADLAKILADIPEKVNTCDFIDKSVLRIINDEMAAFLNESKTAEQTAKVINEKVSLFLNE